MSNNTASEEVFWHAEQKCPVVYIAGTCHNHLAPNARASYGICWGWYDEINMGGSVIGVQSELRAELSGLKRILELALAYKLPSLVIRTNMERLDVELEAWEAASPSEKRQFGNNDLLYKIDELKDKAKEQMYFLDGISALSNDQTRAYMLASSIARFYKPDKKKASARIQDVAIIGVCFGEGQSNPIAAWSTFWGAGDARNSTGSVENKQTSLRASFGALRDALRTAVTKGIVKIRIFTHCESVKKAVDLFQSDKEINFKQHVAKDLMLECKELAEQLPNVTVSLVNSGTKHSLLEQAKAMIKAEKPPKSPKKEAVKVKSTEKEAKQEEEEFEVTVRAPSATQQKKTKKKGRRQQPQPQQQNQNQNEKPKEEFWQRVQFPGAAGDSPNPRRNLLVSYAVSAEDYYVNVSL